jgi:hypothetical protein
MRERRAVVALVELVEEAHRALHVLHEAADASGNPIIAHRCREAAEALGEAITGAITLPVA